MNLDRLPPHSLEAEQGVLGCCLLDPPNAVPVCISYDAGAKFYDMRHRTLFATMATMQDEGLPLDVISLSNRLKNENHLEQVGGLPYISTLPDHTPSPAALDHWLDILDEKYYARQVIAKATELTAMSYENTEKLQALADKVETEIFALRGSLGVQTNSRIDSFNRILERLEQSSITLPGLETGYADLDRVLGGMRPGSVLVLAARPAMGKSSLAMNIAENLAFKRQIPVGFFSLEMSEDELNFRSIGSCARVDMSCFNSTTEAGNYNSVVGIIPPLRKAPLYILDRSDLTINQLRAEARRMVSSQKVQLIVVDYLQLVSGSRRYENRTQEVSEVSRGLKSMARELKVPVLALAQLNREYEKDNTRRPRLSELRESGSIEADSDVVMFIWCPEKSAQDSLRVSVAKNRAGAIGEIDFYFQRRHTRFELATKEPL